MEFKELTELTSDKKADDKNKVPMENFIKRLFEENVSEPVKAFKAAYDKLMEEEAKSQASEVNNQTPENVEKTAEKLQTPTTNNQKNETVKLESPEIPKADAGKEEPAKTQAVNDKK